MALRQGFAERGSPISLTYRLTPAFLHCAKAFIRAKLWEQEAQVDRSCIPSYGRVLADQFAGANASEIDAGEEVIAKTELF